MSDTILSGDFTVYYEAENRQKRIKWTGAATGTRTLNELYSALMVLFHSQSQMDDGVPMKAVTDQEYKIGIIDTGDDDPWFIDKDSMEHVTGATALPMSLSTQSWLRVETTNTGIIKVPCNNTNIVAGDIGYDITGDADSDSGTLLDVKGTGAGSELWIRPDSSAAANSFDNASQGLTCNTHTATQSGAPVSGEQIWAGIESLGNIETNTRIYVYQNNSKLIAYKGTDQWWGDGHANILVLVKEMGTLIDEGYIKVLARQYTKTWAFWEQNLSSGKPKPIPLNTSDEGAANNNGYVEHTTDAATGSWDSGDIGSIVQKNDAHDNQAILTSISGVSPNFTIQLYLIGNKAGYSDNDVIEDEGETKTLTLSSNDTGCYAADMTGLSIVHGADNTFDLDENGTNEYYSIVIDCNNYSLAEVYEWTKYITMRGETGTGNTDGEKAEEHFGSSWRIYYTSMTGTVNEGDVVTQVNTGAKGTVVAIHTTPKIAIIRSSRGTFVAGTDDIEKDGANKFVDPTSCTALTPVQGNPFGMKPGGGKWFLAPGVILDNVPAADLNNYEAIDDQGNTLAAPTKVSVKIENTRIDDWLAIFELTEANGLIKKDTYTIDTQATVGATTLSVDPVIASKVPGKVTGGVLFVVDIDASVEYRYRYTSWSGDDFTLFNLAQQTADASGCDSTTLKDLSETFQSSGVKVGDIIFNSTESKVAYVVSVDSETQLTTTPVTDWTSDTYRIGAVAVQIETTDKVYVPFLHVYETVGTDASPGSEDVSVVYTIDMYIRMVARNSLSGGSYKIEPFTIDGTIQSGGFTQAVIRNTDEIIT